MSAARIIRKKKRKSVLMQNWLGDPLCVCGFALSDHFIDKKCPREPLHEFKAMGVK